jgi:quinol monooxygenase YgiN
MADVDLVAVITAKAGSEALVEEALTTLASQGRSDRGCISYELFASDSAPGTLVTVEKWESQDDLDAHMASPHLAEALAAAGEHLDGFPAIHTLRSLQP